MKKIVGCILFLVLAGCAVLTKPVVVNLTPVEVNTLLENPFGHNESIEAFSKNLPERTEVSKYLKKSPRANHAPDTIFNFNFKKSKISVYKTRFSQEFVLGGIIRNSEIELCNGIRQGMTRQEFFQSFTNLPVIPNDTVVLKYSAIKRTFNFYFDDKGKLEKIIFSGSKQ
ncbi:MAG TPA: hypothetical protein VFC87_03965 [Perlabentimonas sp.]|nr:hypothetical protein [Perlabentimonas sp.]